MTVDDLDGDLDGNLDGDLRWALRNRPVPRPGIDLAAVAIGRARAAAARQLHRAVAAVTAIAAVLAAVLVVWIVQGRLAAGGFGDWATTASQAVGSAASSAATLWMWAGVGSAIVAVVVVAAQAALDGSGEHHRWAA